MYLKIVWKLRHKSFRIFTSTAFVNILNDLLMFLVAKFLKLILKNCNANYLYYHSIAKSFTRKYANHQIYTHVKY